MPQIVKLKIHYPIVLAVLLTLLTSNGIYAQESADVDIIPASAVPSDSLKSYEGETTHAPMRLTPDKSELVRLDKNAASIIVGNPAHLSVLAESATTLVLVPRAPGATFMTVLDQNGDLIMARHVIVASPQKKYVRIRKSCSADAENCQNTQVYYCPDMCHEISISSGAADASAAPDTAALTQGTQGAGNAEALDPEATEE